jgi:hypothetical protein
MALIAAGRNGATVQPAPPIDRPDASGLKALFDAVPPIGDIDDIGPA